MRNIKEKMAYNYKLIKTIFFMGLLAFLLSFSVTQARAQTSYIIVHAHNPEGVEIASLEGMGYYDVIIYDGFSFIGYGVDTPEMHNKPIAISPGTHSIQAEFNGMIKEQSFTINPGETKIVSFTFERTDLTNEIKSKLNKNIEVTISSDNQVCYPAEFNIAYEDDDTSIDMPIHAWGCGGYIWGKIKVTFNNSHFEGHLIDAGGIANDYYGMGIRREDGGIRIKRIKWKSSVYLPFACEGWYVQGLVGGSYGISINNGNKWALFGTSPIISEDSSNVMLGQTWGEELYTMNELQPGTYDLEVGGYMSRPYSPTIGYWWPDSLVDYNVSYDFKVGYVSNVPYDLTGAGVKDNQPPIASFTYFPEKPHVYEEITFDASSSYDPDGNIVSYNWNFGDGVAYGRVVNNTYANNENYTVVLNITDNNGFTATTELIVEVKPELIAKFRSLNKVESSYVDVPHMAGGLIHFDASDSSPNNEIKEYRWEFGDGTTVIKNDPIYDKIFYDPEIYVVNLTVMDSTGLLSEKYSEIIDLSLIPGDLIFLRSDWRTWIFNLVWLNYTHVGMYVGKFNGIHYMVETTVSPPYTSTKNGVHLTKFPRWSYLFEKYADAVRVNVPDPDIRRRAVAFALSKSIGTDYHGYDLDSILKNSKQLDEKDAFEQEKLSDNQVLFQDIYIEGKNYYCSELIWAAYYRASNGTIDLSSSYPGAIPPDGIFDNVHISRISSHHEHYPE